mgnify:CR=1 FL=1
MDAPVTLMEVVPGTVPGGEPPVWAEFRQVLARREPGANIGFEERFAFYDVARDAYLMVRTGETRAFGNALLRKGLVTPRI